MEAGYLEAISSDLQEVQAKLSRHYKLRSGTAEKYAHIKLSLLDQYLRPALVLLFSRLFGNNGKKAIYLATIVQLIFISSNIHAQIPDEDVDKNMLHQIDPRDGTQLPVLVGDYLYGKFFSLLCEGNILENLKPLSDIICIMNEGAISRIQNEQCEVDFTARLEDIRCETAELIAGACRLGSKLGQADQEEEEIATRFGLSLGMGFGLIERGYSPKLVHQYQQDALRELAKLNDSAPVRALESLTNAMFGSDTGKLQWMVG